MNEVGLVLVHLNGHHTSFDVVLAMADSRQGYIKDVRIIKKYPWTFIIVAKLRLVYIITYRGDFCRDYRVLTRSIV